MICCGFEIGCLGSLWICHWYMYLSVDCLRYAIVLFQSYECEQLFSFFDTNVFRKALGQLIEAPWLIYIGPYKALYWWKLHFPPDLYYYQEGILLSGILKGWYTQCFLCFVTLAGFLVAGQVCIDRFVLLDSRPYLLFVFVLGINRFWKGFNSSDI